jgi:hypothetical protein
MRRVGTRLLRWLMKKWKLYAGAVVLALTPLVTIVASQGGLSRFNGEAAAIAARQSVGGRRDAVLASMTELYVARDVAVTRGMRDGSDYAPSWFLNAELKRRGLNWRVADGPGNTTNVFDVS